MDDHKQVTTRFKHIHFLIIACIVIILAAVVYLLASGHVVVRWQSQRDSVVSQTRVCSDALIASYNQAIASSSQSAYEKALDKVGKQIEKVPNANADPNCAFMLYTYDMSRANYTLANTELQILQTLAKKGSYATNQLTNVQSLVVLDQSLHSQENNANAAAPAPSVKKGGD